MFWPDPESYALATWLVLRGIGIVAAVAFASLMVQLPGLYGDDGIVPLRQRLDRLRRGGRSWTDAPSLFWFDASPRTQWVVAGVGFVASLLVMADLVTLPALLVVYATYLSFVNVGSPFLSYQWDVQLLEVSLIGVVVALRWPPSPVAIVLLWLFVGRFMLASGAAKLRSGDRTWRDGTAMTYHFWTQPLPTRVAWYVDKLPDSALKAMSYGSLVIEVGLPLLVLAPWPIRAVPLVGFTILLLAIAITGNYGFFNLLALILLIGLIPDDVLLSAFAGLDALAPPIQTARPALWQGWIAGVLAGALIVLQLFWIRALFGTPSWLRRILSRIAPWRVASQYGLFANMTTERPELIIEGTRDGETWHAYRFPYKVTDPTRPPRWNAPHQPRLDWQLWFAALGSPWNRRWLDALLDRLREGSPAVRRLLAHDPFAEGEPPADLRIRRERYRFTGWAERRETGRWWTRTT